MKKETIMNPDTVEAVARAIKAEDEACYGGCGSFAKEYMAFARAAITAFLATPEAQQMQKDAERWREFLKRARVVASTTSNWGQDHTQTWGAEFEGDHRHVNHAIDAAILAQGEGK